MQYTHAACGTRPPSIDADQGPGHRIASGSARQIEEGVGREEDPSPSFHFLGRRITGAHDHQSSQLRVMISVASSIAYTASRDDQFVGRAHKSGFVTLRVHFGAELQARAAEHTTCLRREYCQRRCWRVMGGRVVDRRPLPTQRALSGRSPLFCGCLVWRALSTILPKRAASGPLPSTPVPLSLTTNPRS